MIRSIAPLLVLALFACGDDDDDRRVPFRANEGT
jgi:hypothetical protein